MFRRTSFLIGLVALLLATPTALAQGPVRPQHSDPTWQASYWNNTTLSGGPVLQRAEAAIDYNWGSGSPASGVSADRFSARWTRYIYETPGTYRFTATSDDGIRVWIDGDLIIDQWNDHAARTFTADKPLTSGHHLVTVEFYENAGQAVAKVSWAPVSGPIAHWRGEYFNNVTLSGSPALVRDDAQINFNWGNGAPAPGINADKFSARWTRTLDLAAGSYRFTLTVDDGARLWVNGHLLIDTWQDQPARTYTGEIYVPGGGAPVKLEYYERGGQAVVQLAWTPGVVPAPTPVPGTVIVDDLDTGFVTGGSSSGWRTAPEGYNNRLVWTRNNDIERPYYNWARWYPQLAPGRYEVFVFIPERYTTTSNAVYWVSHAEGYTQRGVDQSANGGRWVSLGTYTFRGTRDDYVSLNDITGETRLTRLIAFDAVKWEPR